MRYKVVFEVRDGLSVQKMTAVVETDKVPDAFNIYEILGDNKIPLPNGLLAGVSLISKPEPCHLLH